MKYSVTPLELYNMVLNKIQPYSVMYMGKEYIWRDSTYCSDTGMLLTNLSGDTMAFVNERCISYTDTKLTKQEKEVLMAMLWLIKWDGSEVITKMKVYYPAKDGDDLGEMPYSGYTRLEVQYVDPVMGKYRWYTPCFLEEDRFVTLVPGRRYTARELGL